MHLQHFWSSFRRELYEGDYKMWQGSTNVQGWILQRAVTCVSAVGLGAVTAISVPVLTAISWPQTTVIASSPHRAGRRGSLTQRCCFTPSLAESLVGACGLQAPAASLSIARLDSCRRSVRKASFTSHLTQLNWTRFFRTVSTSVQFSYWTFLYV